MGVATPGASYPRAAAWLAAGLLVLFTGGCASYSTSFRNVEQYLVANQPKLALTALEKQRRPKRDQVLYLLNRAMLLRLSRQYEASNREFEAAKKLMTQLYGLSVREQATSLVINDATKSYAGEEYEQVLVYLYKTLNYVDLGRWDAARVEALQVDVKLREMDVDGRGSKYAADALTRYLTGMIYEARGEWSDAMIAYRKAYQAYLRNSKHQGGKIPDFLKYDLLRLAQKQGLSNEVRMYQREFGIDKWSSVADRRKQGELVFLLQNDLAPIKREHSVNQINPKDGHWIRIALPYYQPQSPRAAGVRISVNGKVARAVVAEDIYTAATGNLKQKMPLITARAITRAVVKAKLAEEARKEAKKRDNPLLSLITEVATVATERADTRSWLTLPYNIYLVRVPLTPGRYTVNVQLLSNLGHTIANKTVDNVVIRKGKMTLRSTRWVPPGGRSRR